MMLIVGGAGCFIEYWCHHRPAKAAKAAHKAEEHH